jgi:Spy/CpxP family protein refolding chaperone
LLGFACEYFGQQEAQMKRPQILRLNLIALVLASAAMPAFAQTNPAPTPSDVSQQVELAFWQSVVGSGDLAQFSAYLKAFPSGTFAELAKVKMAALSASTPTPPSPPAKSEPAKALETGIMSKLRLLAQSQTNLGKIIPANIQLPPRPALLSAVVPSLPSSFCSAEARNAFHDTVFKPAIDRASNANKAAIAHMAFLRQNYDEARAKGDINTANALARESKSFEAIAQSVYEARSAFDPLFNRILEAPIAHCAGTQP